MKAAETSRAPSPTFIPADPDRILGANQRQHLLAIGIDCPLTSTGTTVPGHRNLRLAQDDDHGSAQQPRGPGFSVLRLADAE
jgi:hypothetical protein